MSSARLPAVTSDIPRDLRLFVDRVREVLAEGVLSQNDVRSVVRDVVGREGGNSPWLDGDNPDIERLLEALTQAITDGDLYKYLGERIQLIELPETKLQSELKRLEDARRLLEARLADLDAELTKAIRDIVDGETDIAVKSPAGYTTLRGLKVSTSLNSAAILKIEDVSEESGSVTARTLYGLDATIHDPETGLESAHARITNEELVRASADEATASQINDLNARVNDPNTGLARAHARITTEEQTRATADAAHSSRLTNIESTVNDSNTGLAKAHARITAEEHTRATADEAMAGQVSTLTSRLGHAEGAINQINTVSSTSTSANAQAVWQLTSRINDPSTGLTKAHAEINQLNNVHSSSTSALTQRVLTMDARLDGQAATVRQLDQAMVGYCTLAGRTTREACVAAGGQWMVRPFAEAVRQVQITTSDNQMVGIESLMRAQQDALGHLNSQYTVKIDANGYVAGFGLAVTGSGANGASSEFLVRADRFAVGSVGQAGKIPFIVQTVGATIGGVYVPPGVYMDTAMIRDGSITNAKIANAAITSANIQDASITNAKIANASIDTAKIIDATITTAKIQDASITNAKIANASIDSAKIRDLSVTNAHIENLTVGTQKLAYGAVTAVNSGAGYGSVPTVFVEVPPGGMFVYVLVMANILRSGGGNATARLRAGFHYTTGTEVGISLGDGLSGNVVAAGTFWHSNPGPSSEWVGAYGSLDVVGSQAYVGATSTLVIGFKR